MRLLRHLERAGGAFGFHLAGAVGELAPRRFRAQRAVADALAMLTDTDDEDAVPVVAGPDVVTGPDVAGADDGWDVDTDRSVAAVNGSVAQRGARSPRTPSTPAAARASPVTCGLDRELP